MKFMSKISLSKVVLSASFVGALALGGNGSTAYASSEYTITTETQEVINRAIADSESNEAYSREVIELFSSDFEGTNIEYNELIRESMEESMKLSVLQQEDSENAREALQAKVNLDRVTEFNMESSDTYNEKNGEMSLQQSRITSSNAEKVARLAYLGGIKLVKNRGHNQTAAYMLHGMSPVGASRSWQPSDMYHDNDAWAKKVTRNDGFTGSFMTRFNTEIYGKRSGFLSGNYKFTSGELQSALQNVRWTASFNRRSNGSYAVAIRVVDTFDFAFDRAYDQYDISFGNNYAFAMQTLGLIKEFDITIVGRM
ncbi:hypothetical protein ACEN4P_05160 [Marinilactibacillus psychrotolerans]|uniref:hypothetical protein n=1 Tax=Marinilactibacillus psychrotolerans TaxID=191770 RepID=UPI001C7CDE3A|nr:hypothetical protein [Marinilactibacillus psychrotolerans]GEQ32834.1 hypothetical protein B795N_07160 [Marinilactibacillus psychrotolerans]